ncbi:uncharacterized protein ARB_05924 [Trichophyton benhamiae CBS 112371]|uniref:Helix-turn-helix domain-containing protein n=2 Tax=Trichophyton TaxID=5550 RepID=D4ANV7_ARTBC|nr:uncharacterized protein ARB_05924 [Trichophyton benhamiae CBS 112371]XP_003025710.1 uncharacterized protein TRV_00124 [Trichophyton verrucosum HKI 0517]EFE34968.1 conserved hypothetical protein [Trichophyton benhamiae CBS 112371]EFE45099.1 conserved hypothetical protein [Trichophyton verrucosum HKI 0517]
MGTSASKPARAAASAASRRQYPLRPSPSTTSTPAASQPPSQTQPQAPTTNRANTQGQEKASTTRSEAPTPGAISEEVKANPSLLTLMSRTRISAEAEADMESLGRKDHAGRRFVDVVSLKQIISMRDGQGVSEEVIETQFGLKKGTLTSLGPKGVVADVR